MAIDNNLKQLVKEEADKLRQYTLGKQLTKDIDDIDFYPALSDLLGIDECYLMNRTSKPYSSLFGGIELPEYSTYKSPLRSDNGRDKSPLEVFTYFCKDSEITKITAYLKGEIETLEL